MTPTESKKRDANMVADIDEARDSIRRELGYNPSIGSIEATLQTYLLAGCKMTAVAKFHEDKWRERNRAREEEERAEEERKAKWARDLKMRCDLRKTFKHNYNIETTWPTDEYIDALVTKRPKAWYERLRNGCPS